MRIPRVRISEMAPKRKLTPNLDLRSTNALNLTVLQRADPFVEEILLTASHVVVYKFNVELHEWSRKDVNGVLFVVKRNAHPRFQFIVMNRQNPENLVEDLLGGFEHEVHVPFILYRNAAEDINGIWFYISSECDAVANLFSRILNVYQMVPFKPKISSTQSEHDKLEMEPSLAVAGDPLEPLKSSAATPVVTVPDDSSMNLSSKATTVDLGSATSGQSYQTSTSIPGFSHAATLTSTPLPTFQSSLSQVSSTSLVTLLDSHESSSTSSCLATNHVEPSLAPVSSQLMMTSTSSSMPMTPSFFPPVTVQWFHGTPLLQPFCLPSPIRSLSSIPNYGPLITRDKVCDALARLVQNDQFVDMVYQEIRNAHHS